jgi:hypothetical protein
MMRGGIACSCSGEARRQPKFNATLLGNGGFETLHFWF